MPAALFLMLWNILALPASGALGATLFNYSNTIDSKTRTKLLDSRNNLVKRLTLKMSLYDFEMFPGPREIEIC